MFKYYLLFICVHLHFSNAFPSDDIILNENIEASKKEGVVLGNKNTTDTREDEKNKTSLDSARTEYDYKPMSYLEHELMTCKLRMQILKWKQENLPSFDSTTAEAMSRDQVPTLESNCVSSSELAREFAQMRDEIETLKISKQKTEQELERSRLEHEFQVNKLQYEIFSAREEVALLRQPGQNLSFEVEKIKQNLYDILSNQSIQFHQENIHLKLNNTQLKTDNLILKYRLEIVTEENNLLIDKMSALNSENNLLKVKVAKFENNSKSSHLPYEDFVTEIERKLEKDNRRDIDELKTQFTSLSEKIGKIEHDLVNISDAIRLQEVSMEHKNKANENKCKTTAGEMSSFLIEDTYHFISDFKANWSDAQEYCQSRGLQFIDNDKLFSKIISTIESKFSEEEIPVWVGKQRSLYSELDIIFNTRGCKRIRLLSWMARVIDTEDCSEKLYFWCHLPSSACNSSVKN